MNYNESTCNFIIRHVFIVVSLLHESWSRCKSFKVQVLFSNFVIGFYVADFPFSYHCAKNISFQKDFRKPERLSPQTRVLFLEEWPSSCLLLSRSLVHPNFLHASHDAKLYLFYTVLTSLVLVCTFSSALCTYFLVHFLLWLSPRFEFVPKMGNWRPDEWWTGDLFQCELSWCFQFFLFRLQRYPSSFRSLLIDYQYPELYAPISMNHFWLLGDKRDIQRTMSEKLLNYTSPLVAVPSRVPQGFHECLGSLFICLF